MATKLVGVILAIGFLVLMVALFVPQLIDTPSSDYEESHELDVSESVEVRENVRVTLDAIDEGNSTANVTVTDLGTLSAVSLTINESEFETATPESDPVNVTLQRIDDTDTAVVTVGLSRTYGWNPAAAKFAENLDIILALVAFIVVIGFLLKVMP